MATVTATPATEKRQSYDLRIPVSCAMVMALLGVSYYPNFLGLIEKWSKDPNYSHGFFVIPIAAYILWERREKLDVARIRPRWFLFLPLLLTLGTRIPLHQRNLMWVEEMTIPATVGAIMMALGGWHLFWWSLPAVLFLGFMIPLPPILNAILSGPLQTVATMGSVFLLQATGLPAISEGNVILVGDGKPLEVARACNGLSMLLSFATLITATAILCRRPLLDKIILMLSIVPIAIFSNIIRIALTAYFFQMPELVNRISGILGWSPDDFTHDGAGYLMMPMALALIYVELKLLDLLLVPDELANSSSSDLLSPVRSGREEVLATDEKPQLSTRIPSNPNDFIMAATGMKLKKTKPDKKTDPKN
jgi:exosortase